MFMIDIKPDAERVAMEKLSKQGLTLSSWAKRNDVSVSLVRAVITGKCAARINKGHKIAVLLGIKDGEIVES
jgi:gp16 family phage-associated protein